MQRRRELEHDQISDSNLLADRFGALYVQSSQPSFLATVELVARRNITKKRVMIERDNPTPTTVEWLETGLTKFGGSPLGLGPTGILERSTPNADMR